jgi:hypothetical protein
VNLPQHDASPTHRDCWGVFVVLPHISDGVAEHPFLASLRFIPPAHVDHTAAIAARNAMTRRDGRFFVLLPMKEALA